MPNHCSGSLGFFGSAATSGASSGDPDAEAVSSESLAGGGVDGGVGCCCCGSVEVVFLDSPLAAGIVVGSGCPTLACGLSTEMVYCPFSVDWIDARRVACMRSS